MNTKLAAKLLKAGGWTLLGTEQPEEKSLVILMAPHTSIWDFVWGYLYYESIGEKHLRTVVKKEFFFWPLGRLLRALGCVPVDRKSPARMVIGTISALTDPNEPNFHMVICPEGTRKAVAQWKTGYHTIASKAGVPVYLSTVDYGSRRIGIFQKFTLSGDAREDTRQIQRIYSEKRFQAKYPEDYIA